MARRALSLQPNDGYIMDTAGWVLFKKGAVGEAIRLLEAAYQLQPEESVIAEHLADAYYHSQMPEKAKKLYMRAVEHESNVATVEKIRTKISNIDRQIQSFGSDGGRAPASARSP
jgi:Flp pilus assembly protein TadD